MMLYSLGKYILLLKAVFRKPERWNIYRKEILKEMDNMGIGSLGKNKISGGVDTHNLEGIYLLGYSHGTYL